MKRILLFSFVFIVIIQASNIKNKDKTMIDLDDVAIRYINFQPKEVNKTCLDMKIEKLFTIIKNQEISKKLSSGIPAKEYFFGKNKKLRNRAKKLSGQLLIKKHISYKGNHEWRNLISTNCLVIESKKNHIFVMYPLVPMTLIILDKPFDDIMASKEYENINARGLKNWIDMKGCMQF